MTVAVQGFEKPCLKALLDHFRGSKIRVGLAGSPLLAGSPVTVVCGTICDCNDYDAIALAARRSFLFGVTTSPAITECRAPLADHAHES